MIFYIDTNTTSQWANLDKYESNPDCYTADVHNITVIGIYLFFGGPKCKIVDRLESSAMRVLISLLAMLRCTRAARMCAAGAGSAVSAVQGKFVAGIQAAQPGAFVRATRIRRGKSRRVHRNEGALLELYRGVTHTTASSIQMGKPSTVFPSSNSLACVQPDARPRRSIGAFQQAPPRRRNLAETRARRSAA